MLDKRIIQLRKGKGISQEQLAELLNTTRQAVSKWERGESYPDIDRLKDLAVYFGVSIDYLLGHDVESVSVNRFIERLADCKRNRTFDIGLDQIRLVVSTNRNHFSLLVAVVSYLLSYWSLQPESSIPDAIIEYGKRALSVFLPFNKEGLHVDDIQRQIAVGYMMKEDYASARAYLLDNHVPYAEDDLAECEIQLGNYEEASEQASRLFLSSSFFVMNAQIIQLRALLKFGKTKEAYELIVWTIDFIKSICKKDKTLLSPTYTFYLAKAICERHLGLDRFESIAYLKENALRAFNRDDSTENMRFYYGEKSNLITLIKNSKESVWDFVVAPLQGTEIYEDAVKTYNEIFGGE